MLSDYNDVPTESRLIYFNDAEKDDRIVIFVWFCELL